MKQKLEWDRVGKTQVGLWYETGTKEVSIFPRGC